jgi:hypothetical protein
MLIVPLLSTLMIIVQPSSSERFPLSRGFGSSFGLGGRFTTDLFISCAILNSLSGSSTNTHNPPSEYDNACFSGISNTSCVTTHKKSHRIIPSGSLTNVIFRFAKLNRLPDAQHTSGVYIV